MEDTWNPFRPCKSIFVKYANIYFTLFYVTGGKKHYKKIKTSSEIKISTEQYFVDNYQENPIDLRKPSTGNRTLDLQNPVIFNYSSGNFSSLPYHGECNRNIPEESIAESRLNSRNFSEDSRNFSEESIAESRLVPTLMDSSSSAFGVMHDQPRLSPHSRCSDRYSASFAFSDSSRESLCEEEINYNSQSRYRHQSGYKISNYYSLADENYPVFNQYSGLILK